MLRSNGLLEETGMRDLTELRSSLDAIDADLVRLFEQRMRVAAEVADYKRIHGLPVLDPAREDRVLASRRALLTDPGLAEACDALFRQLMALSREAQTRRIKEAQDHA